MDIDVILSGTSYSITDNTTCGLTAFDGLGVAPLHRLTQRGPQQHGESDVGFRLDPRIFSLVFWLRATSDSDLYTRRATLLRYFKPSETAMTLEFTLDNGDVRRIDANVIETATGLDSAVPYRAGRTGITFSAADPTFYSVAEETVVFALGGGSDAFSIPLPIPWPIGVSVMDQVRTISYSGTWRSYPVIKIVGPITDCVIENETTGEKLDFTGVTINASDYYEIDTEYGAKTVIDSNDYNKIADLTEDSDLATFHLAASADGGAIRNNDIRVTGIVVNEATEVYFRYRTRYIGI